MPVESMVERNGVQLYPKYHVLYAKIRIVLHFVIVYQCPMLFLKIIFVSINIYIQLHSILKIYRKSYPLHTIEWATAIVMGQFQRDFLGFW